MGVSDLPHLNAALNGAGLILLSAGYAFIRRKNVAAHRACMLSALGASALFLASYLVYHYSAGSVRFAGAGPIRAVYFFILITHVVLAAVIVPLALVTIGRALREEHGRHRRLARWTLPIWLYVSATGLLVYAFLYRIGPAGR